MEPMTLEAYLKQLINLANENPQLKLMPVVSSSDDEGNSFHPVFFTACPGIYDGDERMFEGQEEINELTNAVCIN